MTSPYRRLADAAESLAGPPPESDRNNLDWVGALLDAYPRLRQAALNGEISIYGLPLHGSSYEIIPAIEWETLAIDPYKKSGRNGQGPEAWTDPTELGTDLARRQWRNLRVLWAEFEEWHRGLILGKIKTNGSDPVIDHCDDGLRGAIISTDNKRKRGRPVEHDWGPEFKTKVGNLFAADQEATINSVTKALLDANFWPAPVPDFRTVERQVSKLRARPA